MVTYTFTQDDFTATEVNLDGLKTLIVAQITSATLTGMGLTPDGPSVFAVTLTFDQAPSAGDLTTLDTIISTYTYQAFADDTAVVTDTKTAGTNGGTFTQDAWQTRTLNTLAGDVDFVSLSSNQLTLLAGKYFIIVKAPACNVDYHQCRLRNITASSTACIGSNAYAVNGVTTTSELSVTLTVSSTSVFEVQHQCSLTQTDTGFGVAAGFGDDEIYTLVSIRRID